MCGIIGIIGGNPQQHELEAMLTQVQHRGPDDTGYFLDPALGFGHVRLSILDLSVAAAQPMKSPDGRYVLVYNGEFYNHADFRPQLQARGVRFRSRSDTETLLWLLIIYGEAILPKVNGIFAFAFYDTVTKTVLLARDHMGVKPLYYARVQERLLFASEIKALFATGEVEPRLNTDDLLEHLMFHFVAGERTLFHGVSELLPGHFLKITPTSQLVEQFWSPIQAPRDDQSEDEIAETVRQLLTDAMLRQLMSDVPMGIMLSGGLDSSAVAAFSNPYRQRMLGYCFHDPANGYDEIANAQQVADDFNIDLRAVRICQENIPDLLIKTTRYYDEPLPRPHLIAAYVVARAARHDGVKVLLTGEGADEVFGGYRRYVDLGAQMTQTGDLSPLVFANNRDALPRIQRFLAKTRFSNAYRFWCGEDVRGLDIINQQLIVDQKTFLQHFLQRSDRTGMAVGVETRVPMLDIALVEYVNSLPGRSKVTVDGVIKKPLRAALNGVVSEQIVSLPKQPFDTPMAPFLRQGPVAEMINDLLLTNPRSGSLFPVCKVQDLVREMHVDSDPNLWKAVWQLLTTEIWLREFKVAI